jgi:hypothetical protein
MSQVVSRFSINISRIIYCVKQNIIKYADKDIFFTIDNMIYTNDDINEQTNYIFSVFMCIDFFVNCNINDEYENIGVKIFFNHKKNVGIKIIDLLNNKVNEIKDMTKSLIKLKIYFYVFWTKDKLYNYLQYLINKIEENNNILKERLNHSLNFIISQYDIFFKKFNNYIIHMLKINTISIDLDNIIYYFGNYDDECEEKKQAALILVSLLQDV